MAKRGGGVTVVLRKVRSEELHRMYSSPNTVLMIKQRRMRRLGVENAGGREKYVRGSYGQTRRENNS